MMLLVKEKPNRTTILSHQLLSQKSCATDPRLPYISGKKDGYDINLTPHKSPLYSVFCNTRHDAGTRKKVKGLLDHYSR